jgi:chromosomal replication initiation ATPase DnaA
MAAYESALLCVPHRAQTIIRNVSRKHGYVPDAICGESQRAGVTKARRAAAMELRDAGYATTEIGRLQRHHTTVISLLRRRGAKRLAAMAAGFDPDVPDYSGEWI